MSRKKTDFRALKARREAALVRPEIVMAPPSRGINMTAMDIAKAMSEGRYTVLPPKKRGRRDV